MSDPNLYRDRREVLDNILDRMRVLEAEQRQIGKSLRFMGWALGLLLVLTILTAYRIG